MNPSTHKKVVVRRRLTGNAEATAVGFVDPAQLAGPKPLDLLTPEGQVVKLELGQVQAVFFVADFDQAEAISGGSYLGRTGPRLPGLWVRVRGRNHQTLEGILATDLLELWAGVWLSPLYRDSPYQRIFIPRAAVEVVTPLEVLRPPRRRHAIQPGVPPPRSEQFGLFGEESPQEPQ